MNLWHYGLIWETWVHAAMGNCCQTCRSTSASIQLVCLSLSNSVCEGIWSAAVCVTLLTYIQNMCISCYQTPSEVGHLIACRHLEGKRGKKKRSSPLIHGRNFPLGSDVTGNKIPWTLFFFVFNSFWVIAQGNLAMLWVAYYVELSATFPSNQVPPPRLTVSSFYASYSLEQK